MRSMGFIFLLLLGSSAWGGGSPRFWVEPGLSRVVASEYSEGANSGSLAGLGGHVHVFGFFSQSLYTGLNFRYESLDLASDLGSSQSQSSGSITTAGLTLGAFWNRWRLWSSFSFLDEFRQTYTESATVFERKNEGKSYSLGLSFWLWPYLVVGVEHFIHNYDSFSQTTPTATKGTFVDPLSVSYTVLNLSFPFEL